MFTKDISFLVALENPNSLHHFLRLVIIHSFDCPANLVFYHVCQEMGGMEENRALIQLESKLNNNPHRSFALAEKNDRRIRLKVNPLIRLEVKRNHGE